MKIAEYEVVGKRRYSFEGKADGKRISGVTLYCMFKDDRIEGSGVEVISISENILGGLEVFIGDIITPPQALS